MMNYMRSYWITWDHIDFPDAILLLWRVSVEWTILRNIHLCIVVLRMPLAYGPPSLEGHSQELACTLYAGRVAESVMGMHLVCNNINRPGDKVPHITWRLDTFCRCLPVGNWHISEKEALKWYEMITFLLHTRNLCQYLASMIVPWVLLGCFDVFKDLRIETKVSII